MEHSPELVHEIEYCLDRYGVIETLKVIQDYLNRLALAKVSTGGQPSHNGMNPKELLSLREMLESPVRYAESVA